MLDDLISRQLMQDILDRVSAMHPYRQIGNRESYSTYNEAWTDAINMVDAELNSLPSAQSEPEEFEWCHDCKEYDQEKHCCHRFTKVIRNTVEELKAYPIREDEAIKYLQETGWMGQHDKEMFDKGLNVQLADDSHSYDSLIPEQADMRGEDA